ncbi:MAG: hypothetical protein ACLP0A_00495 [Verrucomicrobiia bacterium]
MKRIVRFLWICLFAVTLGFADDTNLTLTVDGITYNNVRFVHPTPATVTIYHSTGVATIPLAKLPPDLQKQFGYDPKAATQWELAQQQIDAAAAETQRQQAARWKAAQDKLAAEAAALQEAEQKAAAAVTWTVKIQSVLPDGVIARGCPGANPNGPDSKTIVLLNPPGLQSLAEGEQLTATAYRDGIAVAQNRTLEKWVCLPSSASAIAETSAPPRPPAATTSTDSYVPNFPNTGAFGFPQADSTTLFDRPALRFSVFSNEKYLFAQAVVWQDNDPSPGKYPDGSESYHSSTLTLILDDDGIAIPNVDRRYSLYTPPGWPGLAYQVYLGQNHESGLCHSPTGRGAIRYDRLSDGRQVRIDTYLIPLDELSRRVGDKIWIYYSAFSPKPLLSVNSLSPTLPFHFFQKGQPYVLAKGHVIDPTKVPNSTTDTAPNQ